LFLVNSHNKLRKLNYIVKKNIKTIKNIIDELMIKRNLINQKKKKRERNREGEWEYKIAKQARL
jgi:hypothetical protein